MAVITLITDEKGDILCSFIAQPRVPTDEPLDLAHAIRDLVSQVTRVEDTTPTGE